MYIFNPLTALVADWSTEVLKSLHMYYFDNAHSLELIAGDPCIRSKVIFNTIKKTYETLTF